MNQSMARHLPFLYGTKIGSYAFMLLSSLIVIDPERSSEVSNVLGLHSLALNPRLNRAWQSGENAQAPQPIIVGWTILCTCISSKVVLTARCMSAASAGGLAARFHTTSMRLMLQPGYPEVFVGAAGFPVRDDSLPLASAKLLADYDVSFGQKLGVTHAYA